MDNIKRYLTHIYKKLAILCEQGINNVKIETELDFQILYQTCLTFDQIRDDQWIDIFENHNPDVAAYVIRLILKIQHFLSLDKMTPRLSNAFVGLKLQLEDFWISGFFGALLTSATYDKILYAMESLSTILYDPFPINQFKEICKQFGMGKNHNSAIVNGQLNPVQITNQELLSYVKEDENTYTTNLITISLDYRPLLKKTVSKLPYITLSEVVVGIYDQAKHILGNKVMGIHDILVISGDEPVESNGVLDCRTLTFGWRLRHHIDGRYQLILSHNCIFHMLKVLVGNNYNLKIEENGFFHLKMSDLDKYKKPAWTSNYLHYIFNFCGMDLYFDHLINFPIVKNGFYGAPQRQGNLGECDPLYSPNPFLTIYSSEAAIYLEDHLITRIAINRQLKHLSAQLLFPIQFELGAMVSIADVSQHKRKFTQEDVNESLNRVISTYSTTTGDGIILWDFCLDYRHEDMDKMEAAGLILEDFQMIWHVAKAFNIERDIKAFGKHIETLDKAKRIIILITGGKMDGSEISVITDFKVVQRRIKFTGNSISVLSINNELFSMTATGKWVGYVNGDFYLPHVTLIKDFKNKIEENEGGEINTEIIPLDLDEYIAKSSTTFNSYGKSRTISWIGLMLNDSRNVDMLKQPNHAPKILSQLLGMILITYPKFWFFLDSVYSTALGDYLHRTAADTGPLFNEKVPREKFFIPIFEFYLRRNRGNATSTLNFKEAVTFINAYAANDAVHNTIGGWQSSFVNRITLNQDDEDVYLPYEIQIHFARIFTVKCPDSACFKCERVYPLSSIRCACRHLHKIYASSKTDGGANDSSR